MIETERLRLRQWRDADFAPFAVLNADPEVRAHLGPIQTRAESDALAVRCRDTIATRGWGFWAVEEVGGAPFIGVVGLGPVSFTAPFTPATEIAWRLARSAWGKGLATEAAKAAIAFGFERLHLPEIVAFTVTRNTRSRRVMQKLGMTHDAREDFDHPNLGADDPLRPHVLYRLKSSEARQRNGDKDQ